MRIEGREESENVEDRRSMSPGIAITGGAGTLILMLMVWLLGGNPLQLLQQMPQQPGQAGQPMPGGGPPPAGQEELTHFVKVVLRDTELVWDDLFRQQRKIYRYPKLVLFTDSVDSA